MPLTFAHPAAVLPFSRNSKYVNFLAMVLGSMSPDFEYFLRGQPSGEIGHTFIGFVTFNLPLVVIVYLVYKTYVHRTLFRHLPSFLQDTYSIKPQSTRSLKMVVFIYSALLGMLTHVFWDSFTHLEGFMVKKISLLTYTIQLFELQIPVFKILQHGSTVFGIVLILGYMYYRTKRYKCNDTEEHTDLKQKMRYWIYMAMLTLLLYSCWHLFDTVSVEAYGVIVVRIINSALISLLLISLYFNYTRKKKGVLA